MNRIYYYKTLRMMLITFVAAPVMIAASFYVTTIPAGIVTKVIGYIGVAFFGLCFITACTTSCAAPSAARLSR